LGASRDDIKAGWRGCRRAGIAASSQARRLSPCANFAVFCSRGDAGRQSHRGGGQPARGAAAAEILSTADMEAMIGGRAAQAEENAEGKRLLAIVEISMRQGCGSRNWRPAAGQRQGQGKIRAVTARAAGAARPLNPGRRAADQILSGGARDSCGKFARARRVFFFVRGDARVFFTPQRLHQLLKAWR